MRADSYTDLRSVPTVIHLEGIQHGIFQFEGNGATPSLEMLLCCKRVQQSHHTSTWSGVPSLGVDTAPLLPEISAPTLPGSANSASPNPGRFRHSDVGTQIHTATASLQLLEHSQLQTGLLTWLSGWPVARHKHSTAD